MAAKKDNYYPLLDIAQNKTPNRIYALPLIGFLIKIIMLIPVSIELFALAFVYAVFVVINAFVVLFTGKYWERAYEFFLKFMRLSIKTGFFMTGITDSYPGFSLSLPKDIEFKLDKPERPNRFFAIPLVGIVARGILLIPYFIWLQVLQYAIGIALAGSSFVVLFAGRYPETTYELVTDQMRISLASTAYLSGLSDIYPSFSISMNHKNAKIALLIIGVLLAIMNFKNPFGVSHTKQAPMIPSNYNYTRPLR